MVSGRLILVDFRPLKGACDDDPRIGPSDVDAVYERNGCFLFIEFAMQGAPLSDGQNRLLKALAAVPRAIVLVVEHKGEFISDYPNMHKLDPVRYRRIEQDCWIETDLADFRRRIGNWWRAAGKAPARLADAAD